MVDAQTISIVLAGFGIVIAASYYILTLRSNRLTRQAQLFMEFHRHLISFEAQKHYCDLFNMEWGDYDDFERKYGSDNNPEAFAKRMTYWVYLNDLGILLKEKLVDANMVYNSLGGGSIMDWMKWGPIIREQRVRYQNPNWMDFFEYLADEMLRIRKQRGITQEPLETFMRYLPDQ
jgi:hypothetical protein